MNPFFFIKTAFIFSVWLCLTSCSYLIPKPDNLNTFNHWQVRGKISFRTPENNQTGYLSWSQNKQAYDLFISGPLGQGASRLVGDAKSATLTLPNKKPVTQPSARNIMQRYMGLDFPVADIQYWIKGLASPHAKSDITTNSYGLLESLTQHQWTIQFSRYKKHQGYWIPGRVIAKKENITLVFISKEWTIYD
jgi:outer membrane lipoprotein LolB